MKRNSNEDEMKQLLDHHAFVLRTDRKSLFTQIKTLVQQAQEVASKELNQRRKALQKLLEHEDKVYEEEFANKVKSRIEEDVKERSDILLKIKGESAQNRQEFLKSKRVQQYMNSCYEIREALQRQEMQKTKECQLEQMMEKKRSLRQEQELEKYWQMVQQKNMELAERRQLEEDNLKKSLVQRVSDTRKIQMDELKKKREKVRQEKLDEKQTLAAHLEKVRLEEYDRKLQGKPPKVLQYRKELVDMMSEKHLKQKKEAKEQVQTHRQMIAEISRIEAEENAAAAEKKKAFYKATIDYIKFVRRMRDLDQQQQRMYDERIEDQRRVDICTKNNRQREKEIKARIAEQCYADLRKQICEQYEKRLRDEAEKRECKIFENRFVRDEISHAHINEQRRKNRADLDQQIAEIKKIRESEEAKFNRDLKRASNDPDFCSELAEQYVREGTDYLEPHPNWRLFSRFNKQSVQKPLVEKADAFLEEGVKSKSCSKSCGSADHLKLNGPSNGLDGRGDENK